MKILKDVEFSEIFVEEENTGNYPGYAWVPPGL